MARLIIFLPRLRLIIASPKHNTDGKTEDIRRRIVLRNADWFSTGHDDWWDWRVGVECDWSALPHSPPTLFVILVFIHHFIHHATNPSSKLSVFASPLYPSNHSASHWFLIFGATNQRGHGHRLFERSRDFSFPHLFDLWKKKKKGCHV